MFIDEMAESVISEHRTNPNKDKIQFKVKVSFEFKGDFAQANFILMIYKITFFDCLSLKIT